MKTTIVSLVIGLLMIHTLTGQVKIGDNPQNLDPASVLELESTSKALVIPRLTDAQMNAITPLRGALVYNTDQDCIHYFDGLQWINICEALDNSFTVSTRADFLSQINPNARDSTVVITPTLNPDGSTNYNFEVNQITGANIAPSAINGDKIQNGTVGSLDLAEGAVTLPKLADAENGVPGDIIQWDGFNWVLVNENILGITEVDGIVGNEVVGPTDGTLVLNGGGSGTDPYTLDVADDGITNNELADNSVNSIKIQDGQVATADLDNNAVTTVKIANANVTNVKLDKANIPLSGFGAALADVDLGGNKLINVAEPTVATDAATKNYVDSEIINNAADGTETIVTGAGINVVTGDGSAGTPYVVTATEAQDLADVIALDPSAGNSPITDITDPTNPQDAATKAYVDNEITNNAADGKETIVTGAGINVVTGDGSAGTPYVVTATEAQALADVIALGPSAGNSPITDVTDPTNPQDAATKAYVDGIDVTSGEGITVTPVGQDFSVAVTNPVIAMGNVDSNASGEVTIGLDAAGVVRNSIGNYTVNLDSGLSSDYVIQLTSNNAVPRIIQVTNKNATSFDVLIFDLTGTNQDSNWHFTVIRF